MCQQKTNKSINFLSIHKKIYPSIFYLSTNFYLSTFYVSTKNKQIHQVSVDPQKTNLSIYILSMNKNIYLSTYQCSIYVSTKNKQIHQFSVDPQNSNLSINILSINKNKKIYLSTFQRSIYQHKFHLQPIAERVAQNLEIISKTFLDSAYGIYISYHVTTWYYGVASISRLLKITGL